jgi:integrase
LRLAEGPERDRQLWQQALQPTDLLELGGERAEYAAISNRDVERGYGRWLTFCQRRDVAFERHEPTDRITAKSVAAYVKDLERLGNGTKTVLSRLEELYAAALVMDPNRDWRWIRRIAARVRARHVPVRDKHARMVGTDELIELGTALMARAPSESTDRLRAIMFRDGLLIGSLALRPVLRRRNLTSLELGRHLRRMGEGWIVCVPGDETKTGEPIDFFWPDELVPALEEWLAQWRPKLMALKNRWTRPVGDALWVSSHGSPMTQQAIYDRIVDRTRAAFGRSINPHLFRDCAATTLALVDPEHVRIAAPLLGHRSFATTERYYVQANQARATRTHQQALLSLRRASSEKTEK